MMRSLTPFLATSFLASAALLACGGAQKPAASEADTSSLESPSGGDSPASTAATPAPSDSSGSAGGGSSSPTSASAPAASDASATPAAGSNHPTPSATGSIDGQPFLPKLAQVMGPLMKDGRVKVMIHGGSDCVAPADAKPGDGSIVLMVPWQDGYKVDLGSLKRAKRRDMGEAAFVRIADDGKGKISSTFAPTGRLTVVSAPTAQNAFGKLTLDLSSGEYILAGDVDVKVCKALK
jgi:hypothetical protein